MSEPVEKRRVTHAQFYKLCVWVSANAERLMKERPKVEKVVEEVTKELGFEASEGTVKEARKQVGVMWQPITGGENSGKPFRATVELQRLLDEERQRMTLLEGELSRLHAEQEGHKTHLRHLEADLAMMRGLVHHLYRVSKLRPPAGYIVPPENETIGILGPTK